MQLFECQAIDKNIHLIGMAYWSECVDIANKFNFSFSLVKRKCYKYLGYLEYWIYLRYSWCPRYLLHPNEDIQKSRGERKTQLRIIVYDSNLGRRMSKQQILWVSKTCKQKIKLENGQNEKTYGRRIKVKIFYTVVPVLPIFI